MCVYTTRLRIHRISVAPSETTAHLRKLKGDTKTIGAHNNNNITVHTFLDLNKRTSSAIKKKKKKSREETVAKKRYVYAFTHTHTHTYTSNIAYIYTTLRNLEAQDQTCKTI
jgi:hypothetical protein